MLYLNSVKDIYKMRRLRIGFKKAQLKRLIQKQKFNEKEKIKKTGSNFPVDINKVKNNDKTFPFLL